MTPKTYALQTPLSGRNSAPFPEPVNALIGRDLSSIRDLSATDARLILDTARVVKAEPALYRHALDAKQLVMIFEKDSLRTRLTFETGINTLGGSPIFIDQTASRLGERETLADVAHNLERWVNVIVLRTFAHETITKMAEYASVPVINALSDIEHPCQALTDIFTLEEHFGELRGLNIAYTGDGNNVAHSLMLAAILMGANIMLASPAGYGPKEEFLRAAEQIAATTPAAGKLNCVVDPRAAVAGADAVYTDAWASMGQEHEAEMRQELFTGYQVNRDLMALAAPHAVFMHCLPAHRGEEVTDEVIDSTQSIVFDQAENRMHVQKAILLLLLGATEPVAATDSPSRGIRPFPAGTSKRGTLPTY